MLSLIKRGYNVTKREEFLSRCVVVDTETTSKDYKTAEIIEYGDAVYLDGEWVTTTQFFKPASDKISVETSVVTNITNKMVASRPYFPDQDILDHIKGYSTVGSPIFVAHNSFYDMNVLRNHAVDLGEDWICTFKLAKKTLIDIPDLNQLNLPYLKYYMEIEPPENLSTSHRADADCYVTGKLLEIILDFLEARGAIDTNEDYFEQLQYIISQPVKLGAMPFGKHKGKRFEDIPMDYWKWAFEKMDALNEESEQYDPDLAHSIITALDKII